MIQFLWGMDVFALLGSLMVLTVMSFTTIYGDNRAILVIYSICGCTLAFSIVMAIFLIFAGGPY